MRKWTTAPTPTLRLRVEKPPYGGDAIGGKAYASGVFLDGRFVGCKVDTIHFVAGYVAMKPPDLGAHLL